MTPDQLAAWRKALAAKAASGRRQRRQPRGIAAVRSPGMLRIPPAAEGQANRAVEGRARRQRRGK